MAKLTVIEMVQYILSALDSDNVNSISDTEEATQINTLLKSVYFSLISRKDWDFLHTMQNLEGVGDTTKPTKLKIPQDVQTVGILRYKSNRSATEYNWHTLTYLTPSDFITEVQKRDPLDTTVDSTTNDNGVEMYIKNNTRAKYWTSFDDEFIYLDAYQSDYETTSQQSRTAIEGVKRPTWTDSDTFIPDLPEHMFQLLLNEAKSIAFLEMKQTPHPKAEQIARRQYVIMREQEPRADNTRRYVDYGKKSASRGRSHTGWKGVATSSGIRVPLT